MTPDNTSLDTFRLQQHRYFLLIAFEEAEKSLLAGTFPIGAIIVDDDGQVVGRGHNQVFSAEDSTAHAEMEALRDARPLRVLAARQIELMKTWNASRGRPGNVWTMKSEPWLPS